MSMPILDQLPLLASRHASTYAAARLRIAELAPYATLDALTHVLTRHGRRPAGAPEDGRLALLSALVVEAQRSSHPLWTSLLMWAFKPMLRGARRRTIPCRGDTPEDLDQRVLEAFVVAVQKTNPVYVTQGLRWATQGGAWSAGEGEQKEERAPETSLEGANEDGERVWFDGDSFEVQSVDDEDSGRCENPGAEEDAMIERLTARRIASELESTGQHTLLGALLSTGDGADGGLQAYVDRTFPALPPRERAAEYRRLHNEQRKTVHRLNARRNRSAA